MTKHGPELSHFDALGIGALAVLIRISNTVLILLLHLAAVALGVLVILNAAAMQVIPAILYAITAWVLWWTGMRIQAAVGEHPIDLARKPKGVPEPDAPTET
ncbi:MAG: hypothetical protein P9L99_09230 [Candidatus Lernaella stagnicola]|nr:hypothetical protein [Candidatus Lernaella stagnicola]